MCGLDLIDELLISFCIATFPDLVHLAYELQFLLYQGETPRVGWPVMIWFDMDYIFILDMGRGGNGNGEKQALGYIEHGGFGPCNGC